MRGRGGGACIDLVVAFDVLRIGDFGDQNDTVIDVERAADVDNGEHGL